MPIIQLPSSVGGAGDAAAAVTAQLNVGMAQMLQLLELQERRKIAQMELLQRQQQFQAQLGFNERELSQRGALERARLEQGQSQFEQTFAANREDAAADLRLREGAMEAAQGQQMFNRAMSMFGAGLDARQLQLQEERDADARTRADRDQAFREQQLLAEQARLAALDAQRQRQVDAEVAYDEARTGAFVADRVQAENGIASDVARSLDNRYQVSGEGIFDMLLELAKVDSERGSSYAAEADATLQRLTDGQYGDDLPPEEMLQRLQQDPRLPRLFTAVGGIAQRANQEMRAEARAEEVTNGVAALAQRVKSLGDKRLQEEFEEFWGANLPNENADTALLLDYLDGDSTSSLQQWRQRVALEEDRSRVRSNVDRMKGVAPVGWHTELVGERSKGEQLSKVLDALEMAKTTEEVRAAQAQATLLLDPNAKLAAEYMTRLALSGSGGERTADTRLSGMGQMSPTEQATTMRILEQRFGFKSREELSAALSDPLRWGPILDAMDEIQARRRVNMERSRTPVDRAVSRQYRTGF